MSTTPRRMRSVAVPLVVTALAASGLTGCSSKPDYSAICTDPQTKQRVDDRYCDKDRAGGGGGSNAFLWYYLGSQSNARVPAVGESYDGRGGSFRAPRGANVQRGGLPTKGGTSVKSSVKSGGFGGSKGFSSSS